MIVKVKNYYNRLTETKDIAQIEVAQGGVWITVQYNKNAVQIKTID